MAKILVVEDDSVMLRVYEKVFKFEGFEVFTAEDGSRGVELAKQQRPDLILLDVMMPKMSGYQVLDLIKADELTRDIPVIVLTNLMSKQDLDTALAKGAVRCVVKSQHDPKQVIAMAKEVLAERGVMAPPQGLGQQPDTTGGQPTSPAENQAQKQTAPSLQTSPAENQVQAEKQVSTETPDATQEASQTQANEATNGS